MHHAGVWRIALVAGTLAIGTGCLPSNAQRIVGPDGSPMVHVSCGHDQGRCYALAGTHCPNGYEMFPAVGEPGNFLVRCLSYAPASSWPAPGPAAPPPTWAATDAPAAPARAARADGWPPLQSPSPSAVVPAPPASQSSAPAPPTASAATAAAAPSAASSLPTRDRATDIDLGY